MDSEEKWQAKAVLILQHKWIGWMAFALSLSALFFIYDYNHILPKPPQTIHQWRQCDGNSMAMLYAYGEAGLFAPATYHQMSDDGKAAAEFPLLYYIDGMLIKVFGNRHLITRLTTLLLFYLGLFHLFKIGWMYTENWLAALVPVIILHSLPVAAYYATTSLPNLPALSYLIIGLYYLLKTRQQPRRWHWPIIVGMVALAGMTKPTSLLLWLAMGTAVALGSAEQNKSVPRRIRTLVRMGIPLVFTAGWILWINTYNDRNGSEIFLTGIMPVWDMPKAEITDTIRRIKEVWWQDYSYWPAMLWMVVLSLPFIFRQKDSFRFYQITLVIAVLGCMAYGALFFYQFHQHDYYIIEIYSVLIALCVAAMYVLAKFQIRQTVRMALIIITGLFMLKSIQHADAEMHERYTLDASYNAFFLDFHELNPLLDEAGLSWEDKVIVPSDPSPNISLYLMDQKGWTNFPDGIDSLKINQWIKEGAGHLIARQASFESFPFLYHFTDSLLIEYKTLQVWSITPPLLQEKP